VPLIGETPQAICSAVVQRQLKALKREFPHTIFVIAIEANLGNEHYYLLQVVKDIDLGDDVIFLYEHTTDSGDLGVGIFTTHKMKLVMADQVREVMQTAPR